MEMQMDPSDVVDFGIFIGEENCALGTVQFQEGCTYADIRCEIVNDEVIGYPFDFISSIFPTYSTCRINFSKC